MLPIRIATRESSLAMWQAEYVASRLRALHPQCMVELVPMTTRGDRILDRPLAEIGGKGLFLKELEIAMLENEADIAVHSLKDVPMVMEPGFAIGAVLERADAADAFVSNHFASPEDLPSGARVGTSSLRRQAQLRALRPDLDVLDLRGNINTRLAKLDAGDYDAIILACAGLDRLGFGERTRTRLAPPTWVPAIAQGAIAVELRANDDAVGALLCDLDHAPTRRCVDAERALGHALGANCTLPVAGYCVENDRGAELEGLVGDAATGRLVRARATGAADDPAALGRQVADLLIENGAGEILAGH